MSVAYYVAARASLLLIAEPEGIAVFWPAAGLSAGVLMMMPPSRWNAILTGVIVGTLAANIQTGKSWPPSLIFALANAAECWLFAGLCRILERGVPGPTSIGNVFVLFFSAVIASALCATAGAFAFSALGYAKTDPWSIAQIWARSDASGIIVLAPFVTLLFDRAALTRITLREGFEGAIAVVILFAASTLLLAFPTGRNSIAAVAPDAVLLPLIVWIAGRAPPIFSAAAVVVISLIIATTMITGTGVFGSDVEPLQDRLIAAQMAIASVAFCLLILSSMFATQRALHTVEKRLVANLDHSVKNVLSLVIAIIERSFAGRPATFELQQDAEKRIRALALTHKRLSATSLASARLRDIIEDALAPYGRGNTLSIDGDDVDLNTRAAQAFALVFHELVSNAAKHGALSRATGRVAVHWRIEPAELEGRTLLVVTWKESRGPIILPPTRASYGLKTIRGLIPHELGGETAIAFPADGAECAIRVDTAVIAP
ncbi:MAG: MASE1 domain-containing protein [Hyphomicrobium sp.]|nr:MASE1 domain-containing protein [Hyphomicrobium sp.]